ncbi:MAG TPA: hypothetical protein VFT01_06100 [Homoserinimonas sp.]|nr:hypothetical protein [Homoserinimonas sp.]
MVTRAGEDVSSAARRLATRWGIVFGVLLLAFAGTVVTLNSTLYSAAGFVSSYLDALSRHDLEGALAMPGVEHPPDALPDLLVPDAMGQLSSYSLVSDEAVGDDHTLLFDVHFAGDIRAEIEFTVEYTGQRFGVFSGWQFTRSPIGVLQATPLHATDFEVNGVTVTSTDGANQPSRFQVVTPGIYTLSHQSKFLEAEPATFLAASSAGMTAAELDIQASQSFVDQVNTELAAYLDDCATQQVLLPTDCPFGQPMSNRIEGLPEWSIVLYPQVTIVPAEEGGVWLVPPTPAAAHLTVQVRSLYDGSLSTFDEDVPFEVEYAITFPGDGSLLITPR